MGRLIVEPMPRAKLASLLEAVDEILELDEDEWIRRLIMTTPPLDSLYAITNAQQIAGIRQIKQAINKARLPSTSTQPSATWREVAANWYVSIQLSDHPSVPDPPRSRPRLCCTEVSRNLLCDSRDALRDLGRALCRWDGREDPPGLAHSESGSREPVDGCHPTIQSGSRCLRLLAQP